MTATAGLNMPAVIRKVARIHDDWQLEQMTLDWANDCKGLTDDASQLFTATELHRVRCVTKTLVQLCGFPQKEIEPMVRSVLLNHPRRASALALIEEYDRDADHFDKLQYERKKAGTQ